MHKVYRAAMVVVLMLLVGPARAVEVVISGTVTNPTVIGTDIEYDRNGIFRWSQDASATGTVAGVADSLTVSGAASVLIGTRQGTSDPATQDMVIDFTGGAGTGDIILNGNNGDFRIGLNASTNDVTVYANSVYIQGNSNYIDLHANTGKTSLILNGDLAIDRGNNFKNALRMRSGNASLYVAGTAFIGDDTASAKSNNAELEVAGDEVYIAGGIVIKIEGNLSNLSSAAAGVTVGGYDGAAYSPGDIFLTGDASINGSAGGLTLTDLSQANGGVSLSGLYVGGEGNSITGTVDASSLLETVVDGEVDVDDLTVSNFFQTSGDTWSDQSSLGLTVNGTVAKVSGGTYTANTTFTDASLKYFDVTGTGPDSDQAAIPGGNRTFTGVAGADQTIRIGRYGFMEPARSDIVDMNVLVDGEGSLLVNLIPGDAVTIASSDPTGPVGFFVDTTNSLKFDYENLWTNGDLGFYDLVTNANPLLLVDAGANATVDIPDFRFNGMFGSYQFGAVGGDYGLTGYADSPVAFNGSHADAARAYGSLHATYGKTVQSGLSAMAYRAALVEINGRNFVGVNMDGLAPAHNGVDDGFGNGFDGVNPGLATQAEWNSFSFNMLNLLDIAAGRADKSTVGLYNGSAAYGVNQASASTALSHSQIGMRRSNEIRTLYTLMRNTVDGNDAYAASILNQCYTNNVWAGGFGVFEDADTRHGFDGYKYKSGGFALGYDRMVGPNLIVGASIAATFGDYEDKSALKHDSDIDSYSFNLYATYTHNSGFFASVFGGYTYSDNDIKELRLHNLNERLWNTAEYHTNTWIAGSTLGYDWKPSDRFVVTPSLGVTWITSRSSAHTEYLADVAVARYNLMKTNQTYLPVEVAFGYDAYECDDRKLSIAMKFGYAYNFNNDHIRGSVWQYGFNNGIPYAAVSREPGHHTFTAGAGLRFTKGRLDIGAKYGYARKAKMDSHRVFGTIGISF